MLQNFLKYFVSLFIFYNAKVATTAQETLSQMDVEVFQRSLELQKIESHLYRIIMFKFYFRKNELVSLFNEIIVIS